MTEILEYLYHYSNIDFTHKMYHNKNSKYYIVQKKKQFCTAEWENTLLLLDSNFVFVLNNIHQKLILKVFLW